MEHCKRISSSQILKLSLNFVICLLSISSWLISNAIFPTKINVFILIGTDLTLINTTRIHNETVYTHILTPPNNDNDKVYAMIQISNEKEIRIQNAICTSTLLYNVSDDLIINSKGILGYTTNPLLNVNDVHMQKGFLRYIIILKQNEYEYILWDLQGDSLNELGQYVITLKNIKTAYNISPPFNLTCIGWIQFDVESDIDKIEDNYNTIFWNLAFRDSNLLLTKYADIPINQIYIMNYWIKILKQNKIILSLFGLLSLIYIYKHSKFLIHN